LRRYIKGEATDTSEYTENLASESVTLQIRASMGFTFTTPGSGFTISPGPPVGRCRLTL